ncbi:MAG: hypothetical protein AB4426_32535 [Xenococcaceae cyanobacterium]
MRQGILQNARESVIEVLETRFEQVPSQLSDHLNSINDLAMLKQLLKRSITVASPEEFEQVIAQEEISNITIVMGECHEVKSD